MNIITIQTGELYVNTYVVHDETGKECIIIDPGGSFLKIKRIIDEYRLIPKAILLTHGHFDHIGAVEKLNSEYDAPVYIHRLDADMLIDSKKNLSAFLFKQETSSKAADFLLEDNQKLDISGIDITVLHTPGHSPGGVVFLIDGVAFTGDTLFKMSIGRADFIGCDSALLDQSLKLLKKDIPKDYKIFPGHGVESTFEDELKSNPYLD